MADKRLESVIGKLRGGVSKEEVGSLHSNGYRLLDDDHASYRRLAGGLCVGEHVDTGELVLVKVVPKESLKSEAQIQKIIDEIEVLSSIEEIGVPYLYEVNYEKGDISIIMEHCPYSLEKYMDQRDTLNERSACHMFCDLVLAVKKLHDNDIAHLRIQKANIYVKESGSMVLYDFGRCVRYASDELIRIKYSSVENMCPEAVADKKFDPKKADMWSLGLLLFNLLSNSGPFDYVTEPEALPDRVKDAQVIMPRFISSEAKSLLRSLLQLNPASRLDINQLMEHPWMVENCPDTFPSPLQTTDINTAAIMKMSANFKVDKQFHKTMIDSLMTDCKNWLTAK